MVYYADRVSGVNDPSGGTIGAPFLTAAYAISRTMPGDTVYLRGSTWTEQITEAMFPFSGSSAAWITVAGYPGETAVLSNAGFPEIIRIADGSKTHLEFRDLIPDGAAYDHVDEGGGYGITMGPTSQNIRLRRLHVRNCWSNGIIAGGSNHELLDLIVHTNGRIPQAIYSNGSNGLYAYFSNTLVRGGQYYYNRGYGIRLGDSNAGATADYNIIERVFVHLNGPGVADGAPDGDPFYEGPGGGVVVGDRSNTLRYSIVAHNGGNGVESFGFSGKGCYDFHCYNVTIAFNSGNAADDGLFGLGAFNSEFINDIFFGNGVDAIVDSGLNHTSAGLVQTTNVDTDPSFVDAGNNDFHIQLGLSPASPAINAGTDLGLVEDFAGNVVPFGGAPDIGAYESGAGPSSGPAGGHGDAGQGGTPDSGSPSVGAGDDDTPDAGGVLTDTYSDHDMQCPAAWENGFKEGLITRWGDVERASSHLFTGEWQGSTFSFQIADKEHKLRKQAASFTERYWNDPLTVRMTTRANRALLGAAYTVFCGPIIDAQTDGMGTWDVTLGDVVSQGLLSDQSQVPWRVVRDGFPQQLDFISDSLDRDAPEPILYGRHTRAATDLSSPSSSEGLRTVPIYLGLQDVLGDLYHTWMVAGHAVSDVEIYVDDVQHFEFLSAWLIPHQPLFQTAFGAPYRDLVSDTYGNVRRYTLIYGKQGVDAPDDCALGDRTLTAAVWGIEDVGDGSGALITDRFQQYKHFLINYVANQGAQSYMSGPWLTNPTWDLFDGPVEKVDEDSFDAATTIGFDRLFEGYLGAAAIGIQAGDRFSVKKWIADWNRSCACRFAISHTGQMYIFLLSPTTALKSVAPLYTDAYEILEDSFRTDLAWDEHANSIPYKADFNNATGEWITNGVETDATSVTNYGRTITSETREYPFAPGDLQAQHLAQLELRIRTHRPQYIRLSGTIGPDPVTDESLGYREAGHYIRYIHFDAVSETYSERMAQIITPGIRVGPRIVTCVAMDCEDLIDYDLNSSP